MVVCNFVQLSTFLPLIVAVKLDVAIAPPVRLSPASRHLSRSVEGIENALRIVTIFSRRSKELDVRAAVGVDVLVGIAGVWEEVRLHYLVRTQLNTMRLGESAR